MHSHSHSHSHLSSTPPTYHCYHHSLTYHCHHHSPTPTPPSGECTWEELVLFIFPQDNQDLNQNLENLFLMRHRLSLLLTDSKLPFDQWQPYLSALCAHFAQKYQAGERAGESAGGGAGGGAGARGGARKGGECDINGFYFLLCYLKIPVNGRCCLIGVCVRARVCM